MRAFLLAKATAATFLEPVQNLLSNRAKNAKWTNCKLVFSNLSQFFHNRLFFSHHAKLSYTTQRWGITLNVCSSLLITEVLEVLEDQNAPHHTSVGYGGRPPLAASPMGSSSSTSCDRCSKSIWRAMT